jgi:N-acetylmuramoyl-L-alanine amidase CwlA
MVGTAASAASRFYDPTSKVSAHYGVLLNGSIWHWVDEDNTAYHCGNYTMNQRSIGIEHEDNGDYNGVRPDSLYTTSAKLVKDICTFYNIPIDRQHILKHSEIVATGCPDALDIDRIVREASGTTTVPVDSKVFEELVRKSTITDKVAALLKTPITETVMLEEIKKLINYEDAVIDKDKQLQEQSVKIASLEASFNTLQETQNSLLAERTTLQEKVVAYEKRVTDQGQEIIVLSSELQSLKDSIVTDTSSAWHLILKGLQKLFKGVN